MRRLSAPLAAPLLALLLAACGLLPGASVDLTGDWQLADGTVDGAAIPMEIGKLITLGVEGTTVHGRSACNLYSGSIDVRDGRVSIGQLGSTEMACDPDVMAVEATFQGALPRVDRAARSGDELTLSGSAAELRFRRVAPIPDASLTGTRWTLESLISGETASSVGGDGALQLAADGTLAGSTGCRRFSAHCQRSGDHLTLSQLITAMRPCSTDLAAQDGHVLEVLQAGVEIAIEGDQLTLVAGEGRGLAYRSAGPSAPGASPGGSASGVGVDGTPVSSR
jgi:heat shock protein HslJ